MGTELALDFVARAETGEPLRTATGAVLPLALHTLPPEERERRVRVLRLARHDAEQAWRALPEDAPPFEPGPAPAHVRAEALGAAQVARDAAWLAGLPPQWRAEECAERMAGWRAEEWPGDAYYRAWLTALRKGVEETEYEDALAAAEAYIERLAYEDALDAPTPEGDEMDELTPAEKEYLRTGPPLAAMVMPWEIATAAEIASLPEVAEPAPVPAPRRRFPIFTDEELGQFPPVEWFPGLEGVLPRRELVGLWGPGDSYKSFTALDWSCHLAQLGFDVLYIAAEGVSGLRLRIAAWKRAHAVSALPHLRIVSMPVRMHDGSDVAAFVANVREQMPAPALVVVDTLARNFVGGNENSAQDMGQFVEGCETLRRDLDCTVLVIHHATKDGSSERGGESLRNASFAMYRFERKSRSAVLVTCERMKDAEPPSSVRIEPTVIDLGDGASSLVVGWPFGEARTGLVFESPDEERDYLLRKERIRADVAEVVRSWGSNGSTLSETQIVKRVKGEDGLIRAVAKELALDPNSGVQSCRSVKADGSFGRAIDYFYADPS